MTLPEVDVAGKTVVLVDDIISSGHTVAQASQGLKEKDASKIYCLVTHALFTEGAEA